MAEGRVGGSPQRAREAFAVVQATIEEGANPRVVVDRGLGMGGVLRCGSERREADPEGTVEVEPGSIWAPLGHGRNQVGDELLLDLSARPIKDTDESCHGNDSVTAAAGAGTGPSIDWSTSSDDLHGARGTAHAISGHVGPGRLPESAAAAPTHQPERRQADDDQ